MTGFRASITYKPDGPDDAIPYEWVLYDANGAKLCSGFVQSHEEARSAAAKARDWYAAGGHAPQQEWLEL